MQRKVFTLLVAALMTVAQVAVAADSQTSRSAGAHPVVWDDYPDSNVVLSVSDDVVLTVTGEARTRFEWVENATDFSSHGADGNGDDVFFDDNYFFAPARFNLGFRVDLPRDVAAVVELQSGFDLGGTDGDALNARGAVNEALRPGSLGRWPYASGPTNVGNHGDADSGSTDGDDETSGSKPGLGGNADGGGSTLEDARETREDPDNSADTVHLYQAYIEAANIGGSIASVRLGRQELAYGTEWMLGNRDFYDGISYDGVKAIFEFNDNNRLDVFWMKLQERNIDDDFFPSGAENDVNLYGAYFSTQSLGGSSIGLDAYLMGLDDNRDLEWHLETDLDFTIDDDHNDVAFAQSYQDVWWVGVRVFKEPAANGGWSFSAELTYQWGDVEADFTDKDGDDKEHVNIGAWGFEGNAAYTWDRNTHPSLKFGVTYASGSDFGDYDSADSNTFWAPQAEVHSRLGLADLVEASNVLAFTLGYAGSVGNHSWGVDLYHFELDEVDPHVNSDVLGFNGILDLRDGHGLDDELGQEVDLWYTYQYSKHLAAQFAIAYFNAGDYIEDIQRCGGPFGGNCDVDLDDINPALVIDNSDAWRIYANFLLRF